MRSVVAISITRLVLVILGQWQSDMSWSYNPMLGVETSEIGATLIALSIPGAKGLYDYLFHREKPVTHVGSNYQNKSGASNGHRGTILSTLRRNNHHAALGSQENQTNYECETETRISADGGDGGDGCRGSQDRIYVKVDVQVSEERAVSQ